MHKYVLQHDIRDCGAACLSMVLYEYGSKIPLSYCRELTKTDREGTNLYGIVDGAKKVGLVAEALQGEKDDLVKEIENGIIRFPIIARIRTDEGLMHFITVFSYVNGKFIVGDPAYGKKKINLNVFLDSWTGYIVTFDKGVDYQPKNLHKHNIRTLLEYVNGQKKKLVFIFLLSMIVAFIGIASAYVFQIIIDKAQNVGEVAAHVEEPGHEEAHEHNHDNLSFSTEVFYELEEVHGYSLVKSIGVIFSGLIFLYLIKQIVSLLRGVLIAAVSRTIDTKMVLNYYNHLIDLPVSSIAVRDTGEYISRFTDADVIRDAISTGTVSVVMDTIMAIGCGMLLFFENHDLFYICLVIIVLYIIVFIVFNRPIENTSREAMEQDAILQSYFKETIDGISTIKALSAESKIKNNTFGKFLRYVNAVFKETCVSVFQVSFIELIQSVGVAVILWHGFILVINNELTMGTLISFYALLAYFTEPTKNLIGLQPVFKEAMVAAERLNDVLSLTKEEKSEATFTEKVKCWTVNNISFRYGNRSMLLNKVAFSVNAGEKVAIVGESGCGKTTIAKLFMKYYDLEEGEILANGISIKNINTDDLRKRIAYVDQNTFLFSDSIMNNIRLGNENVKDEDIIEVCKLCGVDEFVNTFPYGYDTVLEENGVNLSGGQRQRIAIARALVKKPELLILDEATSNMDVQTEKKIKEMIDDLSNEISCIIIAHRLSTIKECDRIIVIEDGKIAEVGTHSELLQRKGKYFEYITINS